MLRHLNKILIILAVCFYYTAFPAQAQDKLQDGIIAIVNEEVITYRDMEEYLQNKILQLRLEGQPDEEIKAQIADLSKNGLRRLIQDRIISAEAKQKEINIPKNVIDEQIDNIRKRYPSEEAFLAALSHDGSSISDLRQRIEDQQQIQFLIDHEVRQKIYVNPQEITDYYNAHTDQFSLPERINLKSIFVKKSPDLAAAKEKIAHAKELLSSGQDFDTVAKECSDAGHLGVVSRDQLLPQIESAVWQLPDGKISDIIEVDNGFYIFQVQGRTPPRIVPLDDVKEKIQRLVFNQKFLKKLNAWVAALEQKAFVEIKGADDTAE